MPSQTLRSNPSTERSSGSDRQVNTLLNTLRGEHFRHIQNISGTKPRAAILPSQEPTLPFAQIFGADERHGEVEEVQAGPVTRGGRGGHRGGGQNGGRRPTRPPVTLIEGVPTYAYPDGAVPGPKPPRSWSPLFDGEQSNDPSWRADALSLLFHHAPPAPPPWLSPSQSDQEEPGVLPLTLLCTQVLVETYRNTEDLRNVAPYMPVQAKRDFLRWSALYRPLSTGMLYAVAGEEAHVDGELVVVGPHATLKADSFQKTKERPRPVPADEDAVEPDGAESLSDEDVWDTDWDAPPPLTVLGLVNVALSASLLLSFPPTLTHVALVALSQSVPIHHLPPICPLIEVLDLSFNSWLVDKDSTGSSRLLDAVDWRRWRYLKVLGLRNCGISPSIVKRVNAGRWDDADVIGLSGPPTQGAAGGKS